MSQTLRDTLLRQLDTAWALASLHLDDLTDEDCHWRPSDHGLRLQQRGGGWIADWPERETYDIGPPTIGWTVWHLMMWWSLAWDHTWGAATLSREAVVWPGDAYASRLRIVELHQQWRRMLEASNDVLLASSDRVRWPFADRSLADLYAWANVELTKNAAEIGYARFLKAAGEVGRT